MVKSKQITDVESLQRAINELESESTVQLINIRLRATQLKDNFFLKTDIDKYSFDKGQKVETQLFKLLFRKVLRPKSVAGGTFSTLVSTFVIQKYGKKLTKKLKKLLKNYLP